MSPRLREIVDALPLRAGLRVLEIGCGPGVAARAVAARIGQGHVLAIDRSPRAIAQVRTTAAEAIASGRLRVLQVAVEDLVLDPAADRYHLAFAVRVGALDGRHPELAERALACIARALVPRGRLLVDGGDPLREINLDAYRRRATGRRTIPRARGTR